MKKSLASALLTGAILVTAGASTGWADTITFKDSATNPQGFFSPDDTVSVWDDYGAGLMPLLSLDAGACGTSGQAASNCPDSTRGLTTSDYSGFGSDSQFGGGMMTASSGIPALSLPTGTALGTESSDLVTELAFDDVCQSVPALCLGPQSGALTMDTLNTALDVVPADLGSDNQDLFVAAAAPIGLAEVPESGSLILVGMGLVAGAKYLRRRKVA